MLITRINHDDLLLLSGHLAYVSLLSLVPLITVAFSLLSVFPVFSQISAQVRNFIFSNFMPAAGNNLQRYLEQFMSNTSQMTAIGTCGLIVTALLLIAAVDSVLNKIWRSENKRPIVYSFAVYWMVLTLGPLLVGASVAISSYLLSLNWLNVEGMHSVIDQLLRVLPLLLSWGSFWLLYSLVPTVRVAGKDALIGALVAGILFEMGKKLFSLYITLFPSYQLIYGVLAVIPILFLWIYVSWCIVLLGAEITVSLGEYRSLRRKKRAQSSVPGEEK
ncbi:virulence factor BrkB family protein [Chimaeribacter arupi]